jgi:hypothetical protein
MKRLYRVGQLLLFLSVFLLGGCTPESDRTEKPSTDWSRGLLLGRANVKEPVALQVDTAKHVHLVWSERVAEGQYRLHYAQLNEQGQVLFNEPLSIDLPNPRKPQLLLDAEDNLHLGWLSLSEKVESLYHVQIGPDGQPTEPLLLSRTGEDVDSFRMYLPPDGHLAFVWSGEPQDEQGGVFRSVLGDGSPPTLLIPQGIDPFVLVDDAGTTHLIWLYATGFSARDIFYGTLEGSQVVPAEGQRLTSFEFAESAVYYGPIIGLDTNNVYVIWSVQNLGGGLTPTAAFAYKVSFELGKPSLANPRALALPAEALVDYTEYTSPYGYSELSILPPQVYGSDFMNAPATVSSQESELPVTFSLLVESPAKSVMELAMLVLSEGQPVGYQLVSNTPNASIMPAMVADSDLNLHLAWLDTAGFQEFDVYYASTSPEARTWLDRTTGDDVARGAADLAWGFISAIALVPIAIMWNFPPAMWVILFYIFRGEDDLGQLSAKIALLIGIIIHSGAKLIFLPGLSAGTPFLQQVPGQWTTVLSLAVPGLILVVSVAAAYLYVRRSERATLFPAYVIFAATDGLLTVLIYAPKLFNP